MDFVLTLRNTELRHIPFSGLLIGKVITNLAEIPEDYTKFSGVRSYLYVDGITGIRVRHLEILQKKSDKTLRRLTRSRRCSLRDSALFEITRRKMET